MVQAFGIVNVKGAQRMTTQAASSWRVGGCGIVCICHLCFFFPSCNLPSDLPSHSWDAPILVYFFCLKEDTVTGWQRAAQARNFLT